MKMKKEATVRFLIFIVFVLFVCGTTLVIVFLTRKEDSTQKIVLINPKPGVHIIETPTGGKYIQIKIGNYVAGTFTVSLEMNNFKEGEETK